MGFGHINKAKKNREIAKAKADCLKDDFIRRIRNMDDKQSYKVSFNGQNILNGTYMSGANWKNIILKD